MDKKIINTDKIIIAVDGPAASGKGTIAKKIAKNFNLAHMDSGKLYRASALFLLNSNFDLEDEITNSVLLTHNGEVRLEQFK